MRLKLTLAIIASLMAAPAVADEAFGGAALGRGTYVAVFGGGGFGSSTDITQRGTVFFIEAQGGPLAVNGTGSAGSGGVGFVGAQVGHEFASNSGVLPAFELEGFYLATGTRRATLAAPSDRLPEHTFDNTFPMNNAVLLANMVLSFPSSYPGVTPYIGGGIGAARVAINGADSLQIDPIEPGVNHFNSGPDSSAWTFAAQAKAGVRLAIGSNAFLFGEYRFLYVGSTDQIFGSTVYPFHAPTSPWTVNFDATTYQLATGGIGFEF